MKFIEGLTYDDVLLMPGYSNVLPRQVDTSSLVTRNIRITVPIISAAMDTVTDWILAIKMAEEGALGMLHKNMTIEEQAEAVQKIKRSESRIITDPFTLTPDATVKIALKLMKDNKIGGIPIVSEKGLLVGILTSRDLRFQNNMDTLIAEVMTKENLITAPVGTDFLQAEEILKQNRVEKLPIVDKKGKLRGLITYRDITKFKINPHSSKDKEGRLLAAAAVGITRDMFDRIQALIDNDLNILCIDTAHGHSRGVIDAVKKVKKKFPEIELIAGNVATGEGAVALAIAGADAVKVGVGPGSICTTRVVTGAGMPQLTAIELAVKGLKKRKFKIPVIADGGIKYTGDIPKAIAAGADTVMAGGFFAGAEEAPGETIIESGRKWKTYRGMGSIEAMNEGSKDRYFQDAEEDIKKLVPEGIVGRVPLKGTVHEIMVQCVGGLRAGMGYTGSRNINALKRAKFVKITVAGQKESHPHDVVITKEAPNYSR